MLLPCSSHVHRVPTFRGQNMVIHGGHQDISFLLIDLTELKSVFLWLSHCDLRVVRTTAYLKAIMTVDIYGKTFPGLGYKT